MLPWLLWLRGLSTGLQTKGSLVRFSVRACAWVVGQALRKGHMKGNHIWCFSPSLFPSFLLSKSKINKIIKK